MRNKKTRATLVKHNYDYHLIKIKLLKSSIAYPKRLCVTPYSPLYIM